MNSSVIKSKVIIFALGGNEISPIEIDKNTGKLIIQDLPAQWKRTSKTCEVIADFIKENQYCHYIITHGNGPQIGNILLRSEYSSQHLFKLPLDVCGADSQGALGYMLAQLSNSLKIRDLDINTAEIITQVVVDSNDSAFNNPTKFIGPPLSKDQAQSLMNKNSDFTAKFYQLLENSDISDLSTGKKQNLKSHDLIGLINEATRKRNIPIGKIDIMRKFSFFEVDSKFEQDVLKSFKNAYFNGHSLNVEISKAPKQNDISKTYRRNKTSSFKRNKKSRKRK